jgi:hypothetical protein
MATRQLPARLMVSLLYSERDRLRAAAFREDLSCAQWMRKAIRRAIAEAEAAAEVEAPEPKKVKRNGTSDQLSSAA